MNVKRIAYLSLGTNQGDKLKNLQSAIDLIEDKIGNVQKISSIYKTPSWGFEGDDFFNICLKIATLYPSEALIDSLLAIEDEMGRHRSSKDGYQNRNIDIDILLLDEEVIFSKKLIVPHPKMLQRKFVMVPLVELAPEIFHPIEKTTLTECLRYCKDDSEVIKIDKKLKKPISILKKYSYIAIEGNIGAGKTSLTTMISNEFGAKKILERFTENPFLSKFYKDQKRYAFSLEVNFLADRYQQLTDDFAHLNLFNDIRISDYSIFKSLIFAQITLKEKEYLLYKEIFNLIAKEITKPDLYIYLFQNTEDLLKNIKKRGRKYEKNIEVSYLKKIENGYIEFIDRKEDLNLLTLDVSKIDFVNNIQDYRYIINKIRQF